MVFFRQRSSSIKGLPKILTAPKLWVEFRQGSIGAIRSSLATPCEYHSIRGTILVHMVSLLRNQYLCECKTPQKKIFKSSPLKLTAGPSPNLQVQLNLILFPAGPRLLLHLDFCVCLGTRIMEGLKKIMENFIKVGGWGRQRTGLPLIFFGKNT